MIGLGWATLYATIIEKYEKESKCKIKLQSQSYSNGNH